MQLLLVDILDSGSREDGREDAFTRLSELCEQVRNSSDWRVVYAGLGILAEIVKSTTVTPVLREAAFFGSERWPRDVRSEPKEFPGLVSMGTAEGMQSLLNQVKEGTIGGDAWRVKWKLLRCCMDIDQDASDRYPSHIKTHATDALNRANDSSGVADDPALANEHVVALLSNPDHIRVARELMEKTWSKRKSNTEKLLEGIEEQIQSLQQDVVEVLLPSLRSQFEDVKDHTTKETEKATHEIKAHLDAKDRYDIFVAVQPVPVTIWPIGSLEHQTCLEHFRHSLMSHFRRKDDVIERRVCLMDATEETMLSLADGTRCLVWGGLGIDQARDENEAPKLFGHPLIETAHFPQVHQNLNPHLLSHHITKTPTSHNILPYYFIPLIYYTPNIFTPYIYLNLLKYYINNTSPTEMAGGHHCVHDVWCQPSRWGAPQPWCTKCALDSSRTLQSRLCILILGATHRRFDIGSGQGRARRKCYNKAQ